MAATSSVFIEATLCNTNAWAGNNNAQIYKDCYGDWLFANLHTGEGILDEIYYLISLRKSVLNGGEENFYGVAVIFKWQSQYAEQA